MYQMGHESLSTLSSNKPPSEMTSASIKNEPNIKAWYYLINCKKWSTILGNLQNIQILNISQMTIRLVIVIIALQLSGLIMVNAFDFGFLTDGGTYHESYSLITITLWWGNEYYQCQVTPNTTTTWFVCDTNNSLTTKCTYYNISSKYALQLSNPSDDSMVVDNIKVNDTSFNIASSWVGDNGHYYLYYDLSHPENVVATDANGIPLCFRNDTTIVATAYMTDHDCSSNTNLGPFYTVHLCATSAVLHPSCTGDKLMWSVYSYTSRSWGCRCCAIDATYHIHTNWDIYQFSTQDPTKINQTSPTTNSPFEFGFLTSDVSSSAVTMTLWWDDEYYQCQVTPNKSNEYFMCNSNDSATTKCTYYNISSKYAMQLSNPTSDDFAVSWVKVNQLLFDVADAWIGDNGYYYRYYDLTAENIAGIAADGIPICIQNDTKLVATVFMADRTCSFHKDIGSFWNVHLCAKAALLDSSCLGDKIMWSNEYSTYSSKRTVKNCSCCAINATYYNHQNWDIYQFPTPQPTTTPTLIPTNSPTSIPTINPTMEPTYYPTYNPTTNPTMEPTKHPSLTPTINPSISPSKYPTVTPSNHPTFEPTLEPTLYPTTTPSKIPSVSPTEYPTETPSTTPSKSPTLEPTYYPTTNPTIDPTKDPTTDPTAYPTKDPTNYPTNISTINSTIDPTKYLAVDSTAYPTINPTSSPTNNPATCVFYNHSEEVENEPQDIQNKSIQQQIHDVEHRLNGLPSEDILEYGTMSLSEDIVQCDTARKANICFISCYPEKYCQGSSIIPKLMNIKELIIICEGPASCSGMNVLITNTEITNVSLLCQSTLSCDSMQINITSDHHMHIEIHCGDSLSCQGIDFTQYALHEDKELIFTVIFTCYSTSSCENAYINSNHALNANLQIQMYQYSNNVQIACPNYEDITFVCNSRETIYARYDIDRFKTEPEMFQMVKSAYDSGHLPCEGIIISCSGEDNKGSYQCSMEYAFEETINQNEIIHSDSHINCYWLDINGLFQPSIECFADCAQIDSQTAAFLKENILYLLIVLAIFLVVCIAILFVCVKLKHNDKPHIIVQNPMVIIIGIGIYDHSQCLDSQGVCVDLAVDIDINKLQELFVEKLNYVVYPQDYEHIKISWSKTDLIELFEKQAKCLETAVENEEMDGLICVISSHGENNNIITSDYKLLDKDVIHRIFSLNHSQSRTVPRLFIYDCCSGDDERQPTELNILMQPDDVSKNPDMKSSLDHMTSITAKYKYASRKWTAQEKNPDHFLAKVYSSNLGFQSKMSETAGSYLISKFVDKVTEGLEKDGNVPVLGDIFDIIQEELGKHKQLPEYTLNNNTRMIKLKINKNENHCIDNVPMAKRQINKPTIVTPTSELELAIIVNDNRKGIRRHKKTGTGIATSIHQTIGDLGKTIIDNTDSIDLVYDNKHGALKNCENNDIITSDYKLYHDRKEYDNDNKHDALKKSKSLSSIKKMTQIKQNAVKTEQNQQLLDIKTVDMDDFPTFVSKSYPNIFE